jgi:hypothetical protein
MRSPLSSEFCFLLDSMHYLVALAVARGRKRRVEIVAVDYSAASPV